MFDTVLASSAGGGVSGLIGLIIAIVEIAALWRVFTKAGQHGWAAIIPIYNTIVLLRVAGKPLWWIILLIIPFVNIIAYIIVLNGLSRAFGKGTGFTVGLVLLSFIFIPILGFGDAQYQGPASPSRMSPALAGAR